jgi:hypothetical protein
MQFSEKDVCGYYSEVHAHNLGESGRSLEDHGRDR